MCITKIGKYSTLSFIFLSQPLTEMSTRNLPGVGKARVTTQLPSMSWMSRKWTLFIALYLYLKQFCRLDSAWIGSNWVYYFLRMETESSLWNVVLNKKKRTIDNVYDLFYSFTFQFYSSSYDIWRVLGLRMEERPPDMEVSYEYIE
jgi:hypothetical protein